MSVGAGAHVASGLMGCPQRKQLGLPAAQTFNASSASSSALLQREPKAQCGGIFLRFLDIVGQK